MKTIFRNRFASQKKKNNNQKEITKLDAFAAGNLHLSQQPEPDKQVPIVRPNSSFLCDLFISLKLRGMGKIITFVLVNLTCRKPEHPSSRSYFPLEIPPSGISDQLKFITPPMLQMNREDSVQQTECTLKILLKH